LKLYLGLVPLLTGLMLVLIYGCALKATMSSCPVEIPVLRTSPYHYTGQSGTEYIIMEWEDYADLVRNLKVACLCTGKTKEQCQAN
jgi:hypothetical protein